jgi:hypothetical protein
MSDDDRTSNDDQPSEDDEISDDEISYLALAVGTAVQSSSGTTFGTVEHVLEIPEFDAFDGIVVATQHGLRFVSRDQIKQITSSAVRCELSDEEAQNLPAPWGPPVYRVNALQDAGPSLTAHLGRLFRREHWTQDKNR